MKKYKNLVEVVTPKENQVMCGMVDIRSARRYFVDMRRMIDDKTVLNNPHKGWFWHYVDNGFRGEFYRKDYEPEDIVNFPGMNHLYLRFDWNDIEKEKGVYDFSPLDNIMDTYGKLGYRFAMRVVTCETGYQATPDYVFEEGAKCYQVPYSIQPDYADPIFLKYLEKFMQAFGNKYNGDPRIECIDIGTYGTWGEGHTIEAENRIYPIEVMKKHFDLHAKYFPDTYVLCNDDAILSFMAKGEDVVLDLFEYADARGFGLQDDSVILNLYGENCGYDTLRAPWLFDRLYKNGPTALEFCHMSYIKERALKYYRNGLGVLEAMRNAHASFAGFHGYPKEWLEENHDLAEYCANRLGYWYFLTGAVVPPLTNTAHNKITLEIENRGWAHAYHKYDLKIMLRNEQGAEYIIDTETDNRLWLSGEQYTIELSVDCRKVPGGDYELSVGLFEKEKPIYFALRSDICHDGFYTIGRTSVSESTF